MSGHSELVGRDPCGMVRRWNLSPVVVDMLLALDAWACRQFSSEGLRWPGLNVISGYRAEALVPAFAPTAQPAQASRHRRLPSLAVDLRVGNAPASTTDLTVWGALGSRWEILGGRWGGRFSPPDPNHFDIDPIIAGEGPEVSVRASRPLSADLRQTDRITKREVRVRRPRRASLGVVQPP